MNQKRSPPYALLGAAALLALTALPLAGALSGVEEGPGWLHLLLDPVSDPSWSISISTWATDSLKLGFVTYRSDGLVQMSSIGSGARPTEVGLNMVGESIGTALPQGRTIGITSPRGPTNGPVEVLFWAAGDVRDWAYWINATDPQITVIARGEGAIYWDGSQPSDGLHAHVTVHGAGFAVSDATYHLKVAQAFYGTVGDSFQWIEALGRPPPQIEDEFTHTRPGGATETCFCFARGWEPGEHLITWRGTNSHGAGITPVVAAGVDVDFPRILDG